MASEDCQEEMLKIKSKWAAMIDCWQNLLDFRKWQVWTWTLAGVLDREAIATMIR